MVIDAIAIFLMFILLLSLSQPQIYFVKHSCLLSRGINWYVEFWGWLGLFGFIFLPSGCIYFQIHPFLLFKCWTALDKCRLRKHLAQKAPTWKGKLHLKHLLPHLPHLCTLWVVSSGEGNEIKTIWMLWRGERPRTEWKASCGLIQAADYQRKLSLVPTC